MFKLKCRDCIIGVSVALHCVRQVPCVGMSLHSVAFNTWTGTVYKSRIEQIVRPWPRIEHPSKCS